MPVALSREQIAEAIQRAEKPRDRALISGQFMLAARISELLNLSTDDLEDKGDVLVASIRILKRKKEAYRKVPVPKGDPLGKPFVQWVEAKSGKLFDISRVQAYRIMKKVGVVSPNKRGKGSRKNLLRHSRLSELAQHVQNTTELKRFAGHRISGAMDSYVHLNWKNFVEPVKEVY